MQTDIQPEVTAEHAAIREVVRAAFAHHQSVSRLVDLIRRSPQFLPDLSLVARRDGEVVGHVMVSRAQLVDPASDVTHDVLTLSPLAVAPAVQRRGVGSTLVRAALAGAQLRDEPLVALEGSPRYYPRFGFQDCRAFGVSIELPEWARPEAGMVFRLPSYRSSVRGRLVYPPAFSTYEQA